MPAHLALNKANAHFNGPNPAVTKGVKRRSSADVVMKKNGLWQGSKERKKKSPRWLQLITVMDSRVEEKPGTLFSLEDETDKSATSAEIDRKKKKKKFLRAGNSSKGPAINWLNGGRRLR